MRKRGIKRQSVFRMHDVKQPEIKYVAYPEIKLVPFPQPKTDRDEEDMGVVLADWHLAKITESYNLDIAKTRVTKLTESIMKIVSLHAPIRKLHLFVTGDVVQGENTHQGSVIGSTSCGALEQVYSHAIPIYTELLLSLNQGIPEVEFQTQSAIMSVLLKNYGDNPELDKALPKLMHVVELSWKKIRGRNIPIIPKE
jgi:hypothetical protein